jgi:hypothetical protein
MSIEIPNKFHAFAVVATALGVATFSRNLGFVSVVRNSVGDYTFTLVQGTADLESSVGVSGDGLIYRTNRLTADTIEVRCTDGLGALVDSNFEVRVWSLPVQDL